jgi:MoxR-like ATPase
MATYDSPGELYQRRSLRDGNTYDELSRLVAALKTAAEERDRCYPLIWIREMGRVHSPSVQGGLLNLITNQDIVLPDGTRIEGREIAWIADSNYQAEQDSTHTLVTFDDALKRRFTLNIKLGYLAPEQEAGVLHAIVRADTNGLGELSAGDREGLAGLIDRVVLLGQLIRSRKAQGELTSAPPPTIYGYLAFLRMAARIRHCAPVDVARSTLLGNVSQEDEEHAAAILNDVFGLQTAVADEPTMGGNII